MAKRETIYSVLRPIVEKMRVERAKKARSYKRQCRSLTKSGGICHNNGKVVFAYWRDSVICDKTVMCSVHITTHRLAGRKVSIAKNQVLNEVIG